MVFKSSGDFTPVVAASWLLTTVELFAIYEGTCGKPGALPPRHERP
jgi:hypothetical protein